MWFTLVLAIGGGILHADWATVFVSLMTLGLSLYAIKVANNLRFKIPRALLTTTIIFIYATLFLGEVANFYEQFWWWDIVLHAGSAIGFGLVGVIVLVFMFKHKKVIASPIVVAMFSFTFAMAIGAVWEIFEFTLDQMFDLSMQKSGLIDTMADLIVNAIGGLVAAVTGYRYIVNHKKTGLAGIISDAVEQN